MNITAILAQELEIRENQAAAAVELLDEGCTVPFIARYRKEMTGSLDDTALRKLEERLNFLRNLDDRRNTIISQIESQGKMTEKLREQLDKAMTLVALEDLYRPYKPKRKTRAQAAIARGLEPLADAVAAQGKTSPEALAESMMDRFTDVPDTAAALAGASDILAERLSDDAWCRARIRRLGMQKGELTACLKDGEDQGSVYASYNDYAETIRKMPGHRILAVNRGEKEGALTVRLEMPKEECLQVLTEKLGIRADRPSADLLRGVVKDAYTRLIEPSVVRELRGELTERAQEGALGVFRSNLEQLLMQPPVAGQRVLGWDPGFRTGCKLAVVDETGKVLKTGVAYATAGSEEKVRQAAAMVEDWIVRFNVTLVALGNGTASRESEKILAGILKRVPGNVRCVIVNEAGASVYSASETASEEFPDLDVGGRSAASLARRLQDPLSELVKIDPCALGVGQYQHDMDQKKLSASLEGVVENCVNRVGADLNTASAALLSRISGLSPAIARNVVAYREENGAFRNRRQLLKVPKLGPRTYEQCAGFLRIRGGDAPLDSTAVHPESYGTAKALLDRMGFAMEDLGGKKLEGITKKAGNLKALAKELQAGEETVRDILQELEKPGRDPRSELAGPVLRGDVMELSDLKEGMELEGTVRNITDFGAFVDIGVHQDGLVHISQMSGSRFVRHPLDVVKVGQIVKVRVLSVDEARGRISLTMKL